MTIIPMPMYYGGGGDISLPPGAWGVICVSLLVIIALAMVIMLLALPFGWDDGMILGLQICCVALALWILELTIYYVGSAVHWWK